jgi:AmmeMemoRadiSam system protein B/AmmeMemoRadiSam system protein A
MQTFSELPVRPAAVAGAFYPGASDTLRHTVDDLLADARSRAQGDAPVPKAIIAPHAGYIYSGPIAATVYARLAPARSTIRRVVLLGPAHRVAVHGLALPGAKAFATPLGTVPVDEPALQALAGLPQVVVSPDAHALEHSLEVHLPFLQAALDSFTLVPLVVGRAAPDEVAQVIDRLWGGDETLIVVSSDLSHYLTYSQAQATDRNTARQILGRQPVIEPHQACGAAPVNGLLVAAGRHGLGPQLLDLRNSGDTAGEPARVVGYASFAFYPDAATQGDDPGKVLIPIARSAIGGVLGMGFQAAEHHEFLQEHGACFVTLTRHGQLRGCIGSLQAHRTLLDDVKANAKAAAFLDPRFQPLTATELNTTLVEISLLSPSERIQFASEDDALAQLRPGIDGVILEYAAHRGTFLPQVWEQLPDPRQFFSHLKRKAGLPAEFWAEGMRLSRYTVTKWREIDLDTTA